MYVEKILFYCCWDSEGVTIEKMPLYFFSIQVLSASVCDGLMLMMYSYSFKQCRLQCLVNANGRNTSSFHPPCPQ